MHVFGFSPFMENRPQLGNFSLIQNNPYKILNQRYENDFFLHVVVHKVPVSQNRASFSMHEILCVENFSFFAEIGAITNLLKLCIKRNKSFSTITQKDSHQTRTKMNLNELIAHSYHIISNRTVTHLRRNYSNYVHLANTVFVLCYTSISHWIYFTILIQFTIVDRYAYT